MASRTLLPLIKRARAGNVEAQIDLGRHYLDGGQGVGRNLSAAAGWLARAFAAGNAEAGRLLAEEVPADLCTDAALFERACREAAAAGSPRALARLAEVKEARGQPALEDWLAAARGGNAAAARRAGELLLAIGEREDARRWLTQAAESGDVAAMARLADLLWRTDDPQADTWMEKSAAGGDVEAMFRVGSRLLEKPVPDDRRQGIAWLRRAAGRGHGRALQRLGRHYAPGIYGGGGGLRTDIRQAVPLLERAAAAGVAEAWWDLACVFDAPRFAGRDPRRAREYLERAAREQVPAAQRALGERLAARAKDLNAWLAAGRWLSQALDAGETAAADALSAIADAAPVWPASAAATALAAIAAEHPALAARLRLAGEFALSEREALFLDADRMDQGWCLLADVSAHFRYKPWRLVRIERPDQRQAVNALREVFQDPAARATDFGGEMRSRSRRLVRLLERLAIDRALFFGA